MIRRLFLRIRCWCTHHDWFPFKDYEMMYRTANAFVTHRSCTRCGTHQIAIPMPDVITVSSEGVELGVEWVSLKSAERIMNDKTNQNMIGD